MSIEHIPTKEVIPETPIESLEPGQHLAEESKNENIENEPIDFKKEAGSLDESIAKDSKLLEEKLAAYTAWKEKLDQVYSELGGTAPDVRYPEQTQLDKLTADVEELKKHREELKSGEELEGFLTAFALLPQNELKIIIETGRDSQGHEIRGKDGKKLKPEAAKSLAQLAFDGAKKITKAILVVVGAVIGGISSGIFEHENS